MEASRLILRSKKRTERLRISQFTEYKPVSRLHGCCPAASDAAELTDRLPLICSTIASIARQFQDVQRTDFATRWDRRSSCKVVPAGWDHRLDLPRCRRPEFWSSCFRPIHDERGTSKDLGESPEPANWFGVS